MPTCFLTKSLQQINIMSMLGKWIVSIRPKAGKDFSSYRSATLLSLPIIMPLPLTRKSKISNNFAIFCYFFHFPRPCGVLNASFSLPQSSQIDNIPQCFFFFFFYENVHYAICYVWKWRVKGINLYSSLLCLNHLLRSQNQLFSAFLYTLPQVALSWPKSPCYEVLLFRIVGAILPYQLGLFFNSQNKEHSLF